MIDIKKSETEFENYISKFDMNESHIERKVRHTFRVEELCEKIAISLGMKEEEKKLAKLIGLLHDIARFEQYTKYQTFSDAHSIDHGDFGVHILKENNYIRKYIETNKYDEIVLKAIKNHNKYSIEQKLDKEIELFCKIIRDADKLDIMYQATTETWKDKIEEIEKQVISKEALEQFLKNKTIERKHVKEEIDKIIVVIAFIYDYNFKENYKIIKENDYINKTINRFNFKNEETKKQIELVRKIANDYIDNQINNS